MGGVAEEILLARAFLSRVAEPANVALWGMVRRDGPLAAADRIKSGRLPDAVQEMVAPRTASADPQADLDAASRRGIRLVVPESDEWPHFAMSSLECTGLERLRALESGTLERVLGGERVPPLALWVRGPGDLAGLGVRSVGIVGARAATDYGNLVARGLASELAYRSFPVVSGGAYGIDGAAHRGALAVGGQTVVVSAGGLDRAYPAGNTELFERAAQAGLLISESPPGSLPQRRRFLTRNRLIAALSTGTVIVEAAQRSGAINTARHSAALGRPVMAVPGPVTSAMSMGCHQILSGDEPLASLVTCTNDVLAIIGVSSDLPLDPGPRSSGSSRDRFRAVLDQLDERSRTVFDGIPAGRTVSPSEIVVTAGLPPGEVLQALPILELAGLVEQAADGFRVISWRSPVPSARH